MCPRKLLFSLSKIESINKKKISIKDRRERKEREKRERKRESHSHSLGLPLPTQITITSNIKRAILIVSDMMQ